MEALRLAIDLLHVPSSVRRVRMDPLPQGVAILLRIAAGDGSAVEEAVRATDRSAEVVREAATFFIEQILLTAEADSYRVLGATPNVTPGELRYNMALLLKWLHPDNAPEAQQSVFVNRVTMAWDDLKTPERRAAYDQAKAITKPRRPDHRRQKALRRAPRMIISRRNTAIGPSYGLIRRALLFLLAGPRRW
jgi:hypothetical protein